MREQFQQYMQTQNYKPNTGKEYTRFIDDLSKHCGRNIYGILSASDLAPVVARYNTDGADYEEGNKYNGGPRAAIKQYLAFLQASGTRSLPASPQLLTPAPNPMTTPIHSAPPLNQILYGPPGTGKTHSTIDEALAILDPAFLAAHRDQRAVLKGRFAELEASKHVRFVTFHQSFSYEDFVEGLRAEPNAEGQLTFRPMNGVFKEICDDASIKVLIDEAPAAAMGTTTTIWKMSLGNRSEENHIYEECIRENRILLGWGRDLDYSVVASRADIVRMLGGANEEGKPPSGVTAVNYFVREMKQGDLVIIADGNSKFRAVGEVTGNYVHLPRDEEGDEFSQSRSVRWLKVFNPSMDCNAIMTKDFTQAALYNLGSHVINRTKLAALLAANATDVLAQQGPQKRVLIIDEINRGNISRIFGELITLIEPSKRAGSDEELSVVLPYSKRPFSIPDNLYLIGTMNTSDRSLTGLDIALRRRFVFKEMPPRPDLLEKAIVEGISIQALLTVMNQRIEALLDREHCLGHAYFLPLLKDNSVVRLGRIFEHQILPLLKEYFFEDWERIGWVLNDHRKPPANRFVIAAKNTIASLFGDDFEGRVQGQSWQLNAEALTKVASYLGVIDHRALAPVGQAVTPIQAAQTDTFDANNVVNYDGYKLERFPDKTVKVFKDGMEVVAMPVLRQLADQLGVSHQNGQGGDHNTRQLGDKVITAALQGSA
jgi:5-methylcytosine-specific restriction protein B